MIERLTRSPSSEGIRKSLPVRRTYAGHVVPACCRMQSGEIGAQRPRIIRRYGAIGSKRETKGRAVTRCPVPKRAKKPSRRRR
jgi:hypothetical protein